MSPINKDDSIYVRCTEKDKRLLKRAAKQSSRSLSNYIIFHALAAAKEELGVS